MRRLSIVLLAAVVAGCSGGTTKVSSKSADMTPAEVFWAKNQLAMQTEMPGNARFREFEVMALSNGDRVYCGEMSAVHAAGAVGTFTPFYMRQSGGAVAASITSHTETKRSLKNCADARAGALRISKS